MFQTVPESRGYSGPKAEWVGVSQGPGTPPLGSDERGFLDEGPLPFHPHTCPARPVSASLPPPAVRRVAPRFSIPPSSQEVMPGGSVNLTCVAVGAPMPYVKWMMGAEELTKEDEMPVGRNVLELSNVVRSANYTCVAISSLGMIEATAQVTVKGEPHWCAGHGLWPSLDWAGKWGMTAGRWVGLRVVILLVPGPGVPPGPQWWTEGFLSESGLNI